MRRSVGVGVCVGEEPEVGSCLIVVLARRGQRELAQGSRRRKLVVEAVRDGEILA